jgi:long-subunit acyl-CoA synthetase (AMP-forming)
VGEICVRSELVMAGYWRDPEATAKAIRGGWLQTGDVGRLDADGYLTLLDRSKDLVISGGTNIYPREVEEALLTHPQVAEVSVIGRPDPEWGEVDMPGANITEGFYVSGYIHAAATAQVIRQAGNDLTRANIMKQAANLKNFENGMLLPGVKLNTSPTDFYPVENKQLMKWNGKSWEMFGEVLGPK